MNATLTINLPKSWGELTQRQLYFTYQSIANFRAAAMVSSSRDNENDAIVRAQASCFFKWSGLRQSSVPASPLLFSFKGEDVRLDLGEIAWAVEHLKWMRQLPEKPVRLDLIDGVEAAAPADLEGLTFERYLTCENLWQGYLATQRPDLLTQMAEILYEYPGLKPNEAETLSIFYWWAAAKGMFARLFPNFLKAVGDDGGLAAPPSAVALRDGVNAQIRALTKGDVTKEREVLGLDVWRALTELDAQAREYDELNRKYPQK